MPVTNIPTSLEQVLSPEVPKKEVVKIRAGRKQDSLTVNFEQQQFTLTAMELEKLFNAVALQLQKSGKLKGKIPPNQLSNELLSRFGLKDARQVIAYLKSFSGKRIESKIARNIAVWLKHEKRAKRLERDKVILLKRRIAFLIFTYFAGKEARAKKRLEHAAAVEIERIENEQEQLEERFEALEEQQQAQVYKETVDALADQVDDIDSELDEAERHEKATKKKYESYELSVDEVMNKFDISPAQKGAIDKELKQCSKEIDQIATDVQKLLEDGKEDEAHALLEKANALNLKKAALEDIQACIAGEKNLYKLDGSSATKFSDAAFILKSDMKLVKDSDDNYYVIGADQELNDMSAKDKLAARETFEARKTDFLALKPLLQQNKQFELDHTHGERAELLDQRMDVEDSLLHLDNQVRTMESATAVAREAAEQEAASQDVPVPTPKPTPANTKAELSSYAKVLQVCAKPAPDGSALQNHQVEAIKLVQEYMQAQLDALSDESPSKEQLAKDMRFINNVFGQALDPSRSTFENPKLGHIPGEIRMQTLLQNLERFGKDAAKAKFADVDLEHELRAGATAPTPFNTKPY